MVAHRLALPSDMSQVHPIFHASMPRKYISDPSHVLQPHGVEVNEDLAYKEESVAIVNFQVLQPNSKTITMVKVSWRSINVEGHSWENRS